MSAKKFIIGNWKMNPATRAEAVKIFTSVTLALSRTKNSKNSRPGKKVEVAICPPAVFLENLAEKKSKYIALGGQNVFGEQKGSFTGEISASMLKSAGAKYVIIGHSERRKMGETDAAINKKILRAFENKLIPILCIGENIRDEEGSYLSFIKEELEKDLAGVSRKQLSSLIIAYEPIYAIGATKALDAHAIYEMVIYIKKVLFTMYRLQNIKEITVPILYGGSVDENNAEDLLAHSESDGFLIGRQSLEPESFLGIIKMAQNLK